MICFFTHILGSEELVVVNPELMDFDPSDYPDVMDEINGDVGEGIITLTKISEAFIYFFLKYCNRKIGIIFC